MKKIKHFYLTCILLIVPLVLFSTDYTISSVDEFNNLNLSAGDTVTWLNGTYSSDERITFSGNGTATNPIILKAETPGGVVFDNGLQMNIAGNYLVVDGFYWNGGYGSSNFIQFRNGTTYAQNSTIQNCAINGLQVNPDDTEPGTSVKHRWIVLYGNYNNVLNCSFMNKSTAGALILVELEYNAEANRCSEVGHTINNNYFFNYEKIDTSLTNAGDSETIRVGTSEFQNVNCRTTVSNNYFVSADGENEIITNKSDNNTYTNNTFRRCRGSLVLRHGSGAIVKNNYFLGENIDGTGGIRIVDSDHIITNNYIQDCITVLDQAKWNNGITFMGGGDSSVDNCTTTSVSNGYQESEDITVSNNTIINTNAPLFFNSDKGSNNNTGTISNNLVYFENNSQNLTDIISGDATNAFSSIGSSLSYSGNIYDGTSLGATTSGFSTANLTATSNGEIYTISGASGTGANIANTPFTDSDVGNVIGACFLNASGNVSSNCDGATIDTLTVSSLNDFSAAGESQTLTISSNINWTVSENSSWITVNSTSGSNNGTLNITVSENISTTSRTAILTIAGSGITRSISVSQDGADNTTSEIFTPDPSKKYYIDSPIHNLRLAATGESEDAYTTTSNTLGNEVEWQFVAKGNGYWHVQLAAGGSLPRLRTDNSENADMQATAWSGSYTYFEMAEGATDNTYFFTLPDGPTNYQRLQVNNVGIVKMVPTTSNGTWESFSITEVLDTNNTNDDNLALNGIASQSSNYSPTLGLAELAIDGNTNGNWNGESVTHTSATSGSWWQVELNEQTNIGDIVIYNRTDCCEARLSNFTVTITNDNGNEVFSETVTDTPLPSTTINADGALGSTVRITTNLTDTALSLAEVEIYTGETSSASCSAGTNLVLNSTIVNFSSEQNTENTVQNIIDGLDTNRWSASGFPQYAIIDLGEEYAVNEVNLIAYDNRDYQFIVEGSSNSASTGFSTLVDASNNSDSGNINKTFTAQTVRYVKLTITGANIYDGTWVSISDFEVICVGNSSSKTNPEKNDLEQLVEATIYPNPFNNEINISISNSNGAFIKLLDLTGKQVRKETIESTTTLKNLSNLAKGVYVLQLFDSNNQILEVKKLIKTN